MLAAVLWTMDRLDQPDAADRLGRLFFLSEESGIAESPSPSSNERPAPTDAESSLQLRAKDQRTAEPRLTPDSAPNKANQEEPVGDGWDAVRDNALFLSAEQTAWFTAFARLQGVSVRQLTDDSVGAVSYVQLRSQPDFYRGKVVTVRGKIVQANRQQPAANELGLQSFYRVAIAPEGGGEWPIFAYCLSLPREFPTGEQVREPVTLHGVFFKIWSYPYGDGFGLAPVLLTSTFDWQTRIQPAAQSPTHVDSIALACGVVACVIVALLAMALVLWQTRRKPRSSATPLLSDLAFDESLAPDARELVGRLDQREAL